ncbi:MAG: hypothetical protein QOD77_774 [Thermoplasmata archaeon]|nr:hypothetical protein [Thermoplasmata archaeon]
MESPYLLVSPALAGYVAGFVLMAPALQAASRASPVGKGRAFIFAILPLAGLLFAFVAAFLASGNGADIPTPLMLLGAAAAVQCILQGFLVRARLGTLDPADPQDPAFGKLLAMVVACEVLTILAFINAFLAMGRATAG